LVSVVGINNERGGRGKKKKGGGGRKDFPQVRRMCHLGGDTVKRLGKNREGGREKGGEEQPPKASVFHVRQVLGTLLSHEARTAGDGRGGKGGREGEEGEKKKRRRGKNTLFKGQKSSSFEFAGEKRGGGRGEKKNFTTLQKQRKLISTCP